MAEMCKNHLPLDTEEIDDEDDSLSLHSEEGTVVLKVAPCANKHVMTDNNHVMVANNYVTVDEFDVTIGKRHVTLRM